MLAAITLLKQEVEGLEDLDRAAEILIRLLCALPGWGEKNVQVLSLILKKKNDFFIRYSYAGYENSFSRMNPGPTAGY